MEGLGNGFIGEMLATKAGPAVGRTSSVPVIERQRQEDP